MSGTLGVSVAHGRGRSGLLHVTAEARRSRRPPDRRVDSPGQRGACPQQGHDCCEYLPPLPKLCADGGHLSPVRAFEKIKLLVPPPASPVPSSHRIEADGRELRLPIDYLRFLEFYGAGEFNRYITVLSIDNPHPSYDILAATRSRTEDLRQGREDRGDDWPDYPLWPEPGALLMWGASWTNAFYWLTDGDVDDWPVVALRDTELSEYRVEMSATEYLLGLLEGPAAAVRRTECPVAWNRASGSLATHRSARS